MMANHFSTFVINTQRVAFLCAFLVALYFSHSTVMAATAPIYIDTNTNGQFDTGETNASFVGGNGGSTHTRRFDLPADRVTAQDTVVVNFSFVDNSMSISINGVEVFSPLVGQLQNIGTGETRLTISGTYLTTPWIANTNGLPRVRVTISPSGITVQGSRTTTSTSLETMMATTGGFAIPSFISGQNTIVVVNQNGSGADQISGSITASYTPVVRGVQLTKNPDIPSVSTSGTNITYTLGVTNIGNVPITSLSLTDSLAPVICPTSGDATIASLGVSTTINCTATYTSTLNDFDTRGGGDDDIDNTASVTGTQQGQSVAANVNATVSLVINPSLSFDKSVPPATVSPLIANQTVNYYYDVTNNGNVTLNNVNILDVHGGNNTDPLPGSEYVLLDGSPSHTSTDNTANDGVWSVMRPGDTVRFTGTYVVSQDDIDLIQ